MILNDASMSAYIYAIAIATSSFPNCMWVRWHLDQNHLQRPMPAMVVWREVDEDSSSDVSMEECFVLFLVHSNNVQK